MFVIAYILYGSIVLEWDMNVGATTHHQRDARLDHPTDPTPPTFRETGF